MRKFFGNSDLSRAHVQLKFVSELSCTDDAKSRDPFDGWTPPPCSISQLLFRVCVKSVSAHSVVLEGRIPQEVGKQLDGRGHEVRIGGDWAHGKVMAVRIDRKQGVLQGAVSPRSQIGYVSGW